MTTAAESAATLSQTQSVPVRDCPCPSVPVRVETEAPKTDQRQARIDALTNELSYRKEIVSLISKFRNYDEFIASTFKLEGQITGLTESLRLAPPATATEGEATN